MVRRVPTKWDDELGIMYDGKLLNMRGNVMLMMRLALMQGDAGHVHGTGTGGYWHGTGCSVALYQFDRLLAMFREEGQLKLQLKGYSLRHALSCHTP